MAVKALYQDGVLKPREPLPFKELERWHEYLGR